MPNHQGIISNAIKGAPARSGQPQLGNIQQPLKNTQAKNTGSSPQLGNVPSNNASQYKAPQVDPVTTEVNKTGTVESRLNNLTAKGSRYTNLAATDAKREANSRGLINSSMAAAAGTEAGIRAALPIAQQDAKTYNQNRINNQNVQNKFLENRQGANLKKEIAAQGSQLTNQENTLLNELTMKRDSGLSQLTQQEQAQLNSLQMKRDANSAQLNQQTAKFQSGLTQEENAQLNALQMKRDQGLSTLTQAEQAQLNSLQIKRDSAQSGNVINQQSAQSGNIIAQQNNQSGLTQTENAQLNELTMKRDQGLSTLTQAEQAQLNKLQIKRDAAQSQNIQNQQAQANQLSINRDNNSAALNESLATLESGLRQSEMKLDAGLKLTLEKAMQGQKFSDTAKMSILDSINTIIGNSQAQITQVGLSDRTGAQQAAAILDIKRNRDAALLVYENMLKSMPGWKWDTKFTPKDGAGGGQAGGKPGNAGQQAAATNYPTYPTDAVQAKKLESSVFRGEYKDQNTPPSGGVRTGNVGGAGYRMSNDGRWKWDFVNNIWIAGTFNV